MMVTTGNVMVGSMGFTGRVDFMNATIASRPVATLGLCWM